MLGFYLSVILLTSICTALQHLPVPDLLKDYQDSIHHREKRQFANASPEIPRGVYSCGEQGTETITNFINPAYPASENTGGSCKYRLLVLSPAVCQVRVDFVDTNLARPEDGICEDQYLEVTGTIWPLGVKRFCGVNPDQHMYLELQPRENGDVFVDFIVTTVRINSPYKFGLWITQIDCTIMNVLQAPMSCFQYFLDSTGTLKSFNFDGGSYTTDQKYRICIRSSPKSCVVKFSAEDDEFNVKGTGRQGGFLHRLQSHRGGVGTNDCVDDYVSIPKSSEEGTPNAITEDRYCGSILSTRSGDTEGHSVYSVVDGSLVILSFYAGNEERESDDEFDPGFRISYAQESECPKEEEEQTRFMGIFNRQRRPSSGGLFQNLRNHNRRRPLFGGLHNRRRNNNRRGSTHNHDDDDDDDN